MSGISELFVAIIEWAGSHGADQINSLPGLWERDWTFESRPALVSVNGHREPHPSRDGFEVPGYHALVMINGWPAVLVSPVGGTITAGEPGAEDRLIAAFEASHA